jgi:DNA mismatch repair protein MutL
VFHSPAVGAHGQATTRISALCGSAFLQQSLQVEFHATGLKLSGWVGLPEAARSQTDLQYFYLNGRIIRDRLINHAISQAYQDKLHPGRHPCYVLFLTVAPETVDVNVHPTKHEVRFREGRLIHDFIFRHLSDALSGAEIPLAPASVPMSYSSHHHANPPALHVHEQMKSYTALHSTENKQSPITRTEFIQPQRMSAIQDAVTPGTKTLAAHPFGKILSGFREDFILLESEQGLGIVDIGYAQQRICRGRFLLAQQMEALTTRPLLIPTIIQLSAANASLLERWLPDLLTYGIVINEAGPLTYVVRQLPDFLCQLAVQRAFTEIPEKLKEYFTDDALTRRQLLAELLAPYVANPAKITTLHDMNQLLDELAFIETTCIEFDNKSAIKWFSLDELTL